MSTKKSRFIAIEGVDGTGKKTQFDLLTKYIRDELKKPVLELDFPRYGEVSARYIERYLNGEYGRDVPPDLAAMLYAFDRWQAKPVVEKFRAEHPDGWIIANRYVASNLAHQGGKIADAKLRRQFYEEQIDLEFNQFAISRPDFSFVMLLPENIAQSNVDKKSTRSYTTKKRDIHEDDVNHLANATRSYRELCKLFPDKFIGVDCWNSRTDTMKSVDEIHGILTQKISEF
jgi:dTMP kinase